jgi:hypothetical protein
MKFTFSKSAGKTHRMCLGIRAFHPVEIYMALDTTRVVPFHIVASDTPLDIIPGPIRVPTAARTNAN